MHTGHTENKKYVVLSQKEYINLTPHSALKLTTGFVIAAFNA
jgi:hypothetical protein